MSAETRTTSSTGGQKGVKLERFDLIPVGPLTALATHFGRGAAKYDDNQWRKGYEWSKSYAAKQRHDNLFWAGFDYDVCENDPEGCAHIDQHGEPFEGSQTEHGSTCYNHTGSHHLDASNWHGFVLREFTMSHPEHDDRYKRRDHRPDPEPDGYVRRWVAGIDAQHPPELSRSAIFTMPADFEPSFGMFRSPCSMVPVFIEDGDPRFAEANDGKGDAVAYPNEIHREIWEPEVERQRAAPDLEPFLRVVQETVNDLSRMVELSVWPSYWVADGQGEIRRATHQEYVNVKLRGFLNDALNRSD